MCHRLTGSQPRALSIMLLYRSHGLTIAEVWFDEPADSPRTDIVRHHQCLRPIYGSACTTFNTLVLDLSHTEKELWNKIHKDTRYEVRRGREKDGLTCAAWDGNDIVMLKQFCSIYAAFAEQKGLSPLSWDYLKGLAAAGMLDVSWVTTATAENLVYHAHVLVANRSRLLHSVSLFRASSDSGFRNLVGRANRLLHWNDMMRFRAAGVRTYDFGGWYDGTDDQDRLRINDFKEGFGGKVERNWNAEVLVSWKARVMVPLVRSLRRMRHFIKRNGYNDLMNGSKPNILTDMSIRMGKNAPSI